MDFYIDGSKRGANRKRNYWSLIIDEADSTGFVNLGNNTRLCGSFTLWIVK